MASKLQIDIISDVVCPWCIIGYKHLMQAIDELGVKDQVEIQWQPFELNPDMPSEGENLRVHSARKYGSTPESSQQFRVEMTERGNAVGFEFNYFDQMKMVNTHDAHILLEYAHQHHLQTELKLRLFSAFFSEQKDISDHDVLANELTAVGLNAQEAIARISNTDSRRALQEVKSQWQQAGISSVPTVVLNRRSAVSGAHPVESFKQFIQSELA